MKIEGECPGAAESDGAACGVDVVDGERLPLLVNNHQQLPVRIERCSRHPERISPRRGAGDNQQTDGDGSNRDELLAEHHVLQSLGHFLHASFFRRRMRENRPSRNHMITTFFFLCMNECFSASQGVERVGLPRSTHHANLSLESE